MMALSHLIPVSKFKLGFTTCPFLGDSKLTLVELDDKSLGVHKISSGTSHHVVKPPICGLPTTVLEALPPPSTAWEAFYPSGSINPNGKIPGGFGFYLSGTTQFNEALQNGATEVIMSYRMMLQDDWEWVKGGKLPGIFGGVGNLSYGCTGGRQEQHCNCFDLRAMWRANSVGELYAYLPLTDENDKILLDVPPISTKNGDYGYSVGRGAFKLDAAVNKWVSVAFRVKLNDVDHINGEIQLWIDGVSVIKADGLKFRSSEESKIKGMHFQTFFGGHTDDWASPKDQRAWFSDITGVIIT